MTDKLIKVFYHKNCSDGFLAGFNAYVYFRMRDKLDMVEFLEIQYGDALPDLKNKHVYFLDFAISPEKFIELEKEALSVTMLDHHKTALKEYANADLSHSGCCNTGKRKGFLSFANNRASEITLDMEQSGCYMAHKYFKTCDDSGQDYSRFYGADFLDCLELLNIHIQDRDLWKFNFADTKAYYELLNDPKYRTFEGLFECLDGIKVNEFLSLIEPYKIRVEMRENQASVIASRVREVTINGYAVAIVNAPSLLASEVGSILSSKYAAAIMYVVDVDHAIMSIRSKTGSAVASIDIATHFGGGGHRHAAGVKMQRKAFFEFYEAAIASDYVVTSTPEEDEDE